MFAQLARAFARFISSPAGRSVAASGQRVAEGIVVGLTVDHFSSSPTGSPQPALSNMSQVSRALEVTYYNPNAGTYDNLQANMSRALASYALGNERDYFQYLNNFYLLGEAHLERPETQEDWEGGVDRRMELAKALDSLAPVLQYAVRNRII
jgi:hypothetical protein